ncbi:MAG: hypothetical protein ABL901_01145 [Hyphomicrobiaceae bacterium]
MSDRRNTKPGIGYRHSMHGYNGPAPTGKRTRLSDSVEHIDDGEDTIYVKIPAGNFVLILLAVFLLARCTP